MTTDIEDGITWGLPTHLRAKGHSYLTVCGAFATGTGTKDRITDDPAVSNLPLLQQPRPAAA